MTGQVAPDGIDPIGQAGWWMAYYLELAHHSLDDESFAPGYRRACDRRAVTWAQALVGLVTS